jgi:hypothetical protein
MMVDNWQYRIESFRWIPSEGAWKPAPESAADTWFLWGEKGDDHRCFGVCTSRADAERALDYARKREQEPQQATDGPRDQGYQISHRRNGTEDEIIIGAPDGRHMAYIQFWDEEYGEPGSGDKEAKADSRLIVDALNAYQVGHAPSEADAPTGTEKAYHATLGRDPFDYEDAIDIRAPDGRGMAFSLVSEQPDQAKADVQLIVDALNGYHPELAQEKRPAPRQEADEQRRLKGFQATLADHKQSGSYFLESDDAWRHWPELSPERKLSYLAFDAAYFEMPVERLAAAVRDMMGDQPAAVREEVLLGVLLDRERELHEVARLLPGDGRTEPTPLIGRIRQWLGIDSGDRNLLLAQDAVESTKTQLESFSDEFERLARTPEQINLADHFKEFVQEVAGAGMREAFEKILERKPADSPAIDFEQIVHGKSKPEIEQGIKSKGLGM